MEAVDKLVKLLLYFWQFSNDDFSSHVYGWHCHVSNLTPAAQG